MKKKGMTSLISVILAGFLIGAFLPPVSAWTEIDPGNIAENGNIQDLFRPVDEEIRIIVKNDQPDRADLTRYKELESEIVKKYDKNLDDIISLLEKSTEVQLEDTYRTALKEVIIGEHLGRAFDEELMRQRGLLDENALIFQPQILGRANNQEDIDKILSEVDRWDTFILAQCTPDVYSGAGLDGAGLPYIVNGGNNLYEVGVWPGSTTTYQLRYYDEDHPVPQMDIQYDAFRLLYYGTLEDRALFHVTGSQIYFNYCWNDGKTYAWPYGIHGYKYRPKTSVIYTSNIWNHDIDTYNSNPNIGQLVMSVPYIQQ
ncbi:MAG: hypothetical protein WC382_00235 [Methanoregulaceae archaeon]|jgi:hypothetical protein